MLVQKKYTIFFQKQHKKRTKKNSKYFLKNFEYTSLRKKNNNNVFVYSSTSFILSKNFIIFFKTFFKKFFKKKNIKCLFFFNTNYLISSKHKNSRMGKGVGGFKRYSTQIIRNRPFMLFKNVSKKRTKCILSKLTQRTGILFKIYPKIY